MKEQIKEQMNIEDFTFMKLKQNQKYVKDAED
jgi:hypothetical protein